MVTIKKKFKTQEEKYNKLTGLALELLSEHLLPDLHAFAPGAHVLAQQQVVEGDGPNDVELLLHHLLDELRVGAVLAHGGVEGAELPQDGVQGVGALISDAGRPLTETCGLHPGHALDGLVFQHARDCREHTHTHTHTHTHLVSTCIMQMQSKYMSIHKNRALSESVINITVNTTVALACMSAHTLRHVHAHTPIMGWRMFSMHLISCW